MGERIVTCDEEKSTPEPFVGNIYELKKEFDKSEQEGKKFFSRFTTIFHGLKEQAKSEEE